MGERIGRDVGLRELFRVDVVRARLGSLSVAAGFLELRIGEARDRGFADRPRSGRDRRSLLFQRQAARNDASASDGAQQRKQEESVWGELRVYGVNS